MKRSILFSIIAMIGLASCQQKEDFTLPVDGEKMTFYASIADDATKTIAEVEGEKTKVLWAEGDAYAMSVKGGAFAKFTLEGEGGQTTGTFTGTATAGDGTQNVAYYPYADGITMVDGKLNVVISAVQAYSANSIAAAPMVAVSTDNTLKFQNVASLIKITIKGEEIIKSVSLTGNNDEILAGNALVTLEETPSLALAADAEGKTITLDCGEGIQLTAEGVDFYFAVPSITLTKGFTVVATDLEEKAMIKSTTNEVALTASKVKVFPAFEYENNVEGVSGIEEINNAIAAGKNIKLTNDITLSEILVINNDIIFDGNGYTLTSTAGRAINVSGATNVTIKNLTIQASGERAINIIQNTKKVTIDNVTATAANYTVNVATSAPNVVVAINKSTLSGLNVVNIASPGANVTVTNSIINCNDNNTTVGESYAALCLGKDATGGIITATDCIINVTEGSDSQKGRNSAYNGNVTIDGSDEGIRVNSAFIILGDYYYGYETLADALADVKEDVTTVELSRDVVLTEALTIPEGKTLTLDLKGKTISGTDNATTSFGLINLEPGSNLTIKSTTTEGKIKLTATNNRNWNAYSSVISNQRATLTVGENVVIEHLGGTDMAYGIDNLTNTGAQHAKTTIEGATIKSTYRAIRQFLNSTAEGVNNVLHVKSGIIEGANKSIWMQNANAKANPGKLTVEANAQLKGDVLLSGASSTEWPVEVSIAKVALVGDSEVTPNNVPEGFAVVLNNGNYVVKKVTTKSVSTLAELETALKEAGSAGAGYTVINLPENGEFDMSSTEWTPIKVDGYHGADIVTVNGNGTVITGLKASLFAGGFAGGSGIVIKNLTIEGSTIVADETLGYGAFVGCADSMDEITLINCHLKNSSIITPNDGADESRIGGLIGWTAGYNNQNDGPVDSYITVKGCSVTDCTLKGAGSIGGIVGHAGANAATFTTIENCTVTGNTFTSTDDGGWRVGVVVGTANNGQCVIKGITASDNALSQTGKTAPEGQSNLYGRFVPAGTGTLVIDGVSIN